MHRFFSKGPRVFGEFCLTENYDDDFAHILVYEVHGLYLNQLYTWVKDFRNTLDFRMFRLIFHRKSSRKF